jgi:hypothetical protein
VKITLDEADIKAILLDHVRAAFGEQFDLDELRGYSYTTTATFVEAKEEEAQDVSAQ